MSAPDVILYTDGACSGNPGPGGWAAILASPSSGKRVELTGSDPETTNNRMEMMAVLEGLRQIKKAPSKIHVVSDSNYVIKGLTEWIQGWERNGWKTANKKPVKNRELWIDLVTEVRRHQCTFEWVRGHDGHPENERVDQLAVEAYQKYL
ncbi:MAG: ribonuclease HI [Candidatus Eisenbacteria bacterium]